MSVCSLVWDLGVLFLFCLPLPSPHIAANFHLAKRDGCRMRPDLAFGLSALASVVGVWSLLVD